VLTELGRENLGIRPNSTRGDNGEEVRSRIERWKARVDRAHRIKKKIYWKTIGCCARRRKLLFPSLAAAWEEVCFSIRAQVR